MQSKEGYEIRKRLYKAQGDSCYNLDVFGDTIAEREGYCHWAVQNQPVMGTSKPATLLLNI